MQKDKRLFPGNIPMPNGKAKKEGCRKLQSSL